MFYKYATDITYITEIGIKKNKRARTWVSSKRKKGRRLGTFLAFCTSVTVTSVYSNKIPTHLAGMLTHSLALADLASGSIGPNFSFGSRLSLTAVFPWLLITPLASALGPCFSSSSSGLVRNLTSKPFVWASRQNKGILLLALTHTHTKNAHHRATID